MITTSHFGSFAHTMEAFIRLAFNGTRRNRNFTRLMGMRLCESRMSYFISFSFLSVLEERNTHCISLEMRQPSDTVCFFCQDCIHPSFLAFSLQNSHYHLQLLFYIVLFHDEFTLAKQSGLLPPLLETNCRRSLVC